MMKRFSFFALGVSLCLGNKEVIAKIPRYNTVSATRINIIQSMYVKMVQSVMLFELRIENWKLKISKVAETFESGFGKVGAVVEKGF